MSWVDNNSFKNENLYLANLNTGDSVVGETPMRELYEGKTVKDVMQKIEEGFIKLTIHQKMITVAMAKDYVDDIKKVLEHLNNITSRPKTFITSTETKEHIIKAKKINSKAIFYLSRDSADWEIKKANTIIPRKILSDVYNETYNIYENIVFCDLIYLIDNTIKKCKQTFIERIRNNIKQTISGSGFSQRSYYKENIEGIEQTDEKINVNDYEKKIREIENNIRKIKKTDFFKSISKVWHKQYSIQRTNLFVFDKNYKFVYKLWLSLYHKQKQEQKVPEITVSKSIDFEAYYFNYSVLAFLAVLNPEDDKRLKFVDGTENTKILIDKDGFIKLDGDVLFEINKKKLRFSTGNRCIKLTSEKVIQEEQLNRNKKQVINGRQIRTEEFYIHPMYFINKDLLNIKSDVFFGFSDEDITNLLQNTPPEISQENFFEKYTTNMLNQNHEKQHVFYLLPITTFAGDTIITEEKFLKRLFGMGGMFDSDDADAENWRFFRRGILQLTPRGGKTSLDNISRLINLLIVFNDTMDDYKDYCPICNSKNIQKTGSDRECYNCGCFFSMNTMTSEGHNKNLLWIKKAHDNIKKTIQNIDNSNNVVSQLDINERICGGISTASFVSDISDKEDIKIKTICPVCGKTAHQ